MSRVRMVTRTVKMTTATVMSLNIISCECSVKSYRVAGEFSSADELLKAIKHEHETETEKMVHVTNSTVNDVLFGIPEAEFLKVAVELPPRTAGTAEE